MQGSLGRRVLAFARVEWRNRCRQKPRRSEQSDGLINHCAAIYREALNPTTADLEKECLAPPELLTSWNSQDVRIQTRDNVRPQTYLDLLALYSNQPYFFSPYHGLEFIDCNMFCQKCRQPLKLDGSLQELNPAAYDLLVCALTCCLASPRFIRTIPNRIYSINITTSI